MCFLGFGKKKDKIDYDITFKERERIESNFKWIIEMFGYPSPETMEVLLTEEFFPKSLTEGVHNVQNPIDDLCAIFHFDSKKISFEINEDLRDSYGTPYEIQGPAFQMDTEFLENHYKIHIANSLLKKPNKLIYSFIYEFVRIKLTDSRVKFDNGVDTAAFIYLVGIYMGVGVLLTQNMFNIGREDDGIMETKWVEVAKIPAEIIAFALALYCSFIELINPSWTDHLDNHVKGLFVKAQKFLAKYPSPLFDKTALQFVSFFNQAYEHYEKKEYKKCIEEAKGLIELTEDRMLKSDLQNLAGYCQLVNGNYQQAIDDFEAALKNDPENGVVYDNIAYCLLQNGETDLARKQMDLAAQTGNNDIACNNRNYAIYYHKVMDYDQARKYFELAFEDTGQYVDYLSSHYGEFLLAMGDLKAAKKHLQIAANKGEKDAIRRLEELYEQ